MTEYINVTPPTERETELRYNKKTPFLKRPLMYGKAIVLGTGLLLSGTMAGVHMGGEVADSLTRGEIRRNLETIFGPVSPGSEITGKQYFFDTNTGFWMVEKTTISRQDLDSVAVGDIEFLKRGIPAKMDTTIDLQMEIYLPCPQCDSLENEYIDSLKRNSA